MIMHSGIASTVRTCADLFREVLLDEDLCCTFNVVHPFMLYKGECSTLPSKDIILCDYTATDGPSIPTVWSPESGYAKELPQSFYPCMSLA